MAKVSANGRDNPFLSQVMRAARKARPFYHDVRNPATHREEVAGGTFEQLSFPTNGCTWDGCTMCDYGKSSNVKIQDMVDAVEYGLAGLDFSRLKYLEVSPGGSMLDPLEVPVEAQNRIFKLMRETDVPVMMFEARAELITDEAMERVSRELGAYKQVVVMMGLESSDSWIQRYCVNKGSHPSLYSDAIKRIRSHGLQSMLNVSLGTVFLSDSEAIEDTTRSVEWSLNMGADMAVIFPLIVKPHTLLHILQKDGRYHSPSLWSLVEVLRRLGPKTLLPAESDKLPRVGMAWYRNYFSTPAVELADTCEKCYPDVIKLLDEYYKWQSYDIIEELDAYSCECHDSWREGLLLPEKPLPERVVQAYDYLAKQVSLDRFWQKRREGFLGELHKEWSAE